MFAKHVLSMRVDRVRALVRDARVLTHARPSRCGLKAVWRRDPILGRLELRWHSVSAAHAQHAADEVPSTQDADRRLAETVKPRRLLAARHVARLARGAAA